MKSLTIPELYPTETIEIAGHEIKLKGYKVEDKEFEIQIRHLRNEAIQIQIATNKIIRDKEDKIKPDQDLTEEELEKLGQLHNKLDDIADQMDEVCMLLAQRGLKRFYYDEDKTAEELDEIKNISLPPGYAKMIADKMIILSNPPVGVEKSIKAAKKQKADDKGKSGKSAGKRT